MDSGLRNPLACFIFRFLTRPRDQFFTGFARDLFSGLIAAVVQESPGTATLGDAKDFLNMSGAHGEARKLGTETIYLDGLALFCEDICKRYPGSVAARKLQTFTKSTKPNDGAVVTLKEQLAFLDSDEMREFLKTDPNKFSFGDLAKGKVTVYVVLPGSHQETHSRFLRLCLAQGVRYIQRNRPRLDAPIAFFIDEMGTSLWEPCP
jgi:type IV secretory pathway TraG/TraD family ATPase VirD4